MATPPELFTFDIFGTVVDWRAGLAEALLERGYGIEESRFEDVIDVQARLETASYRTYSEITAESLVRVVGLGAKDARSVARDVGTRPLFADSRDGLRRLSRLAPCVAMTNS